MYARRALSCLIGGLAAAAAGCSMDTAGPEGRTDGPDAGPVVVYTALDEEFSRPILERYARQTRVRVDPKFDIESTKSVGLANTIIAEADRPICDLFWNNEILNTLRLKERGLLQPFTPPNGAAYPPTFRAQDGTWYGFAGRARVLIVNTDLVPEAERPESILDLIDPRWKGRVGIAKPLFGTTATHAACLFAAWGPEEAERYFRALKANGVQVLTGNRQVAIAVGRGELAFGLTDTDDALLEIDAGNPVAIVYPDRAPDQLGTLFIPNTLAVIRGAPHPEAAEQLADYLLSPEIEAALATGPSGQIPLNPAVDVPTKVETPRTVHAMEVDFEAAAALWDQVYAFLTAEFGGA